MFESQGIRRPGQLFDGGHFRESFVVVIRNESGRVPGEN
jgi:hypothetical protein